jgi:hypothetical protein
MTLETIAPMSDKPIVNLTPSWRPDINRPGRSR